MCVLMYVMCTYIDVSYINMMYETCVMVVNIFKIFCLKKSYIYIIESQHVFLSWHAMKNLQFMTPKKKTLKKF